MKSGPNQSWYRFMPDSYEKLNVDEDLEWAVEECASIRNGAAPPVSSRASERAMKAEINLENAVQAASMNEENEFISQDHSERVAYLGHCRNQPTKHFHSRFAGVSAANFAAFDDLDVSRYA